MWRCCCLVLEPKRGPIPSRISMMDCVPIKTLTQYIGKVLGPVCRTSSAMTARIVDKGYPWVDKRIETHNLIKKISAFFLPILPVDYMYN